jgi:hypothetical protein
MRSSLLPIDHLVEEVAGPAREELLAHLVVAPAALEQVLDRRQRVVGQRDQEVGPDEDVELGRVQPLDLLVVARELEQDEQVGLVLVDLRPLVAREDVLVVEGVEVEVLLEPGTVGRPRALDVHPADAPMLDELDFGGLRLGRRGDGVEPSTRHPPKAWLGQVRHRDFAARRW